MPTETEIGKIIALHEDGKSQREIAKEFDKSVGWVNAVFKKLNIQSERSNTKRATEAKATYDLAKRRALNDKLFAKLEESIDRDISSSDLKNYCISFGILEDKRQIIEPSQGANGAAAIDIYIEELKREASANEPKAEE